MLIPIHLVRALALAAAAVTSGGPASQATAPQDQPVKRGITVAVRNDNYFDATVYAVRPGLRQRLGFVVGETKGKFSFRWPEGDLRIEINFVGAGHYYSQVIDVQEGDELELTILPYLHTLPVGTVF